MGHRSLWLVLAAILCGTTLLAQEATFVAVVDRNPVGVGEQFTLSFVLTSATMGGGKNLQLPDLSKFHIMAGPSQSSSMQIMNGAVSSTVSYEYVLQPKDVGKFEIGPGAIEVGGKVYRSEKLIDRGGEDRHPPQAPGRPAGRPAGADRRQPLPEGHRRPNAGHAGGADQSGIQDLYPRARSSGRNW